MEFVLHKRGESQVPIAPEFRQIDDKIIGSSQWDIAGERRQERFVVFTVRGGRIVDMQECDSLRKAERFANRR